MDLNIAFIADIHLTPHRIHPEVIPTNLRTILYPKLNDDLDILILGGDITHALIELGSENSVYFLEIAQELIALAVEHNFFIRVLQGTWTHDRAHNQFFTMFSKGLQLRGEDLVKVIHTIDYEHIKALDLSLLYKPDNVPTNRAFAVMRELLDDCGVDKVDLLVNHGYLMHLIPDGMPNIPANAFTSKELDVLSHGLVLTGHVHTANVFGTYITNGSFDRDRFGEEEAKGFFMLTYDTKAHTRTYTFVENTLATRFDTILLGGLPQEIPELQAIMDVKIKAILATKTTSKRVFIRLKSDDINIRYAISTFITKKYPQVEIITELQTKRPKFKVETKKQRTKVPHINIATLPKILQDLSVEIGQPLEFDYIVETLGAT